MALQQSYWCTGCQVHREVAQVVVPPDTCVCNGRRRMDDLLEMTEIVVPTDPEISPVSYIDMLLSSFLLLFVLLFLSGIVGYTWHNWTDLAAIAAPLWRKLRKGEIGCATVVCCDCGSICATLHGSGALGSATSAQAGRGQIRTSWLVAGCTAPTLIAGGPASAQRHPGRRRVPTKEASEALPNNKSG